MKSLNQKYEKIIDRRIYKLLEYGLIEEAGKLDLPGKPMSYKTSEEFLRLFGYSSLDELPELPKYKMDENHQIVIEELEENGEEGINQKDEYNIKEAYEDDDEIIEEENV